MDLKLRLTYNMLIFVLTSFGTTHIVEVSHLAPLCKGSCHSAV